MTEKWEFHGVTTGPCSVYIWNEIPIARGTSLNWSEIIISRILLLKYTNGSTLINTLSQFIKLKKKWCSQGSANKRKNVSFAWGNWKYPKHGAAWTGKVYEGVHGEGWPPEGCDWSLRNQGTCCRQKAVNLKAIPHSFTWGCFWYSDT